MVVVDGSSGPAATDAFSTADDLLRRSDAAMYEAKRSGGGVRMHDAFDRPAATA